MNTAKTVFWRAALFAVLWWALTGGATDAWGIGAVSVAAGVAVSLRLSPPSGAGLSVPGLLAFALFFIAQSLRAGLQVAALALGPRLLLEPAMVTIRLRLSGERERAVLLATLNLLPGTLVAGGNRTHIRVHLLDGRQPFEEEVRAAETRVARLFKAALK
jgi:multicomponent Na+:H+ antiporter subunit E